MYVCTYIPPYVHYFPKYGEGRPKDVSLSSYLCMHSIQNYRSQMSRDVHKLVDVICMSDTQVCRNIKKQATLSDVKNIHPLPPLITSTISALFTV
jgi:hypothetical protein